MAETTKWDSNGQFTGNLTVDADLSVGDDLTITGDLAVTGAVTGATFSGKRVVEAHTAGDTLAAAESGSVHTNLAATGAVTLVLPAATVGLEFIFHVLAAQELRIDPNTTETVALSAGGAQEAAGKYITANADAEFIHLRCAKAGRWECVAVAGTWTAEP